MLLEATFAISALWLRPAVIRNGLIPLAAVVLYLAALNLSGVGQVAKELVVAFVFTTGTFLVAWTNPVFRVTLLAPAAAFFLLCLANLAAIEKWEWTELRAGAEPPHLTTRAIVRTARIRVPRLAPAEIWRGSDPWLSGDRDQRRIETRRVLVGAVLLTPLLFLYTNGV